MPWHYYYGRENAIEFFGYFGYTETNLRQLA